MKIDPDKVRLHVKEENKKAFENQMMSLRMMMDLLGEPWIIRLIGEGLPKRYNKRKRKKIAKRQWTQFKVDSLVEKGMEVSYAE